MQRFYLLFFTLLSLAGIRLEAGIITRNLVAQGDLYLVCIGIDDYASTSIGLEFSACQSDALMVSEAISKEFIQMDPGGLSDHGQLHSFTLLNDMANYEMIRDVFKKIAMEANPEDQFIFFFAGFTAGNYLVPYYSEETELGPINVMDPLSDTARIDSNWISLGELAGWMAEINTTNQLVISEAGYGREFAINMISALFESNPLVASQSSRNRILLTTRNLGSEGPHCGSEKRVGALAYFLTHCGSVLNVFINKDKFTHDLYRTEIECNSFTTTYSAVYFESEYRELLLRHQFERAYRGVGVEVTDSLPTDSHQRIKHRALIVSTNNYPMGWPSWSNLRTPQRDADSLASVLRKRFGFDIHRLHDPSTNDFLAALVQLNNECAEDEKVLIFIAGHGYLNKDFGNGYLVFKDGKSLTQETRSYSSYFPLAVLKDMVDPLRSKHVFLVLDVCFGGRFERNKNDLALTDYSQMSMDVSLREWIERKDEKRSRIIIASGEAEVPDFWADSRDHSPFASKMLKALRQEQEFFSPGKLFLYTDGNVTAPVLKQFGSHENQADFLIPVID